MGDGYATGLLAIAYLVAIACCLRAWRRDAAAGAAAPALTSEHPADVRELRAPWFWLLTTGVLALCAIGKPLDLHEFVADVGRRIARAGGWYEGRRRVQLALAVAAGAASVLALAIVGWRVRRALGRYGITLAGIWLMALYAGLRVVSLHQVDAWLATRQRGIKLHGIVEALALFLIATGAAISGRAKRTAA